MNVTPLMTWSDANQRYLSAALAVLRHTLERRVSGARDRQERDADMGVAGESLDQAKQGLSSPAALEIVSATFGLTAFERDTLLLCAAMELESSFAGLCAQAQGDPQRPYPTFSLAVAALPNAHWSALAPTAPLRRWRLIDVQAGPSLMLSPLRIDERILHFLAGVQHVDERLIGVIEPVVFRDELTPSHRSVVERIAAAWTHRAQGGRPSVIQLCGDEPAGKRAIAAAACAAVGLHLNAIASYALPHTAGELDLLIRLCEREAALQGGALLLDCDEAEAVDTARASVLTRFLESLACPLIVSTRERRRVRLRPSIAFDVGRPTTDEQRAIWKQALGGQAAAWNGQLNAVVSQFDLNAEHIRAVCSHTASPDSLWEACRVQVRPRLDELAQRIEASAGWADVVLPATPMSVLREIAMHVRHRTAVYERWGFAAKGSRGLGISALFAGPSGTGKTMAAEVLANDLRLDLYRIDLSQVVSKYIGETEKNLRRVFDAAEEGGAILLFDEADALFGKRSEVRDSHDRYANIEVSYLLQRMESYRGLAILTTNRKDALDSAFLRRIRFVVQFPFPDCAHRAEIWRRIFPAQAPTDSLDMDKLARLNVAGGNIRNIALNAAFLAAEAGVAIRMSHLLHAARSEYAKLEKPLTETEIGAWT